jgi:hypothetical protein
MSCSDESHSHDHHHHQGAHDHSNDLPTNSSSTGDKFSLYSKIDLAGVRALNVVDGDEAGRSVIKSVSQKFSW